MPRSRARDDDQLMNLGFSGGKAYGGFPSCLLTGTGREPGQECEASPTGGLLLMRFLSCAIHRSGDGKSVLSERAASSKRSCLWGLGGSALNKQPGIFAPAKIPGLASVGPTRHCLPVSRTPYFCPFGRYFFQGEKEDAYTSSFSSSVSFNLMAPSMTPSTMGRYFSGQSCNLWLVRWRCSLSSRRSSGLK